MTIASFAAQVRRHPGAASIDLTGEINGFAEEALNRAFAEAELDNPTLIVLNFSKVQYINSTGIALIVSLLARARSSQRKLAVYGLSEHYLEIFQITRLAEYMTIYADEASAIESNRS